MRKIVSWLVACTFVGLLALVFIPEPVDAMTGSGTAEDPYVIYNVTDLQNMQNDLSAYYVLNCSIDASATSGWNGGAGFEPIGDESTSFTGHFDGNGYTISTLYINRSSTAYVGLFGHTSGSSIGNVTLTAEITGYQSTGALIGYAYNTDISYCIVGATVTAENTLGGMVGYLTYTSTMYFCEAIIDVTATEVSGRVGGLVGIVEQTSTVRYCFSSGSVWTDGSSWVGGLIGQLGGTLGNSCIAQDCYSRASTHGGSSVGGLVGCVVAGNTLDNGYSTGFVSCEGSCYKIGGYVGQKCGACTDGFWDKETSEKPTSDCGTGKTTIEMKTQSTFTGAGWDFDAIWEMGGAVNDGYPYLLWWYDPPTIIDDIYQVVWFQPNAIIKGTELPNRAQSGTLEDGEIHWGANPAGITISHGELIPEEEYNFEPIVPGSQDIIKPEPEAMTTDVDTAALVNNPLYPLVHALGSMPGLNDRLVWLMLAWLAVIASMLFVHIGFDTKKGTEKPQHFVLTTIVGLGLSILFYTMGIFPLWVVILMVFGLIGAIIWERQPVL